VTALADRHLRVAAQPVGRVDLEAAERAARALLEAFGARSIPLRSLCQHHLLPFWGVAHVGYLPGERILGLSKLARVVELFARDLQTQERLTSQVAGWLEDHLDPRGE
jgi:GTP cyclohydrolase I